MSVIKGSCLCGSICYEVDQIQTKMAHCHCSMCRKFHGAAFSTFGEAASKDFRWTSGENHLKEYIAENGSVRQFCEQCGSSLTFTSGEQRKDVIEFSLGTLDDPIDKKPDAHVYCAYKASWININDDLPQFEEGRK